MSLPAPTPLAATTRYIPAGVRKYSWVPTIANLSAPTLAELSAGTDLTGQIPTDGVSGFTTTADDVETGDYGTRFNSKIPGMLSADDSSIRLYSSSNSTDARTLLTEGLNGNIVVYPEGIVTGGKLSAFPVRIKSADLESVAAGSPATMLAQFSITSQPSKNVAIPTV